MGSASTLAALAALVLLACPTARADSGDVDGEPDPSAAEASNRAIVSLSGAFSLPYFGFSVIGPNVSAVQGLRIGLLVPGNRIRTITSRLGVELDLSIEVVPDWPIWGLGARLNPNYAVTRVHPGGTISIFRFGPSIRAQVHSWPNSDTPTRAYPRFGGGFCIRPGLIARPPPAAPERTPRFTLSMGVCIEAMKWLDGYFAGQLEPDLALGVSW